MQNKVKSLNEHQCKVDQMEEELMEIAKKQKHMLNLEVGVSFIIRDQRLTSLRC